MCSWPFSPGLPTESFQVWDLGEIAVGLLRRRFVESIGTQHERAVDVQMVAGSSCALVSECLCSSHVKQERMLLRIHQQAVDFYASFVMQVGFGVG